MSGSKKKGNVYRYEIPEYKVWAAMKQRCLNPDSPAYPNYGGRGITICASWIESFEAFFRDMGKRPSKAHSLDRIEVDAGYGPSNCRWATNKQQSRNTRRTRFVEVDGKRVYVAELIEGTTITTKLVDWRISNGWTLLEAATTPARAKISYRNPICGKGHVKDGVRDGGGQFCKTCQAASEKAWHERRKRNCTADCSRSEEIEK